MAGSSQPGRPTAEPAGILGLPERIRALPDAARERVDRLFEVERRTALTDPPPELEPWLATHFGSVDAVRRQQLVRVTNRISLTGAIFAPLRALRPIDGPRAADREAAFAAELMATGDDPFCRPLEGTPANAFGRIRGRHSMTGANAAAGDAHHGVIVFDRHDPLDFDADLVADVLRVGRDWADAARGIDSNAANYLLIWNCLWRAGGSIVHGHAQVLLGSGRHHVEVERLQRETAAYRAAHDAGYVADLVEAHRDLELATDLAGATILVSLTPAKERELLIVGRPGQDERDPDYTAAVATSLLAYRDALGVRAFNLALLRPPLDADAEPQWRDLPPIMRLVDRGDPESRASDIGAIELLAGTVLVGCDPYDTVELLRAALGG